mgnify:CR=1 FL=1
MTDPGVLAGYIQWCAKSYPASRYELILWDHGGGWYYTDWLTALGSNTSMPTIEVGQRIVDTFVDTCAQKCRGQLTTLSVIDLAELEATLPAPLSAFSRAASQLIQNQEYQTVSRARSGTRAQTSPIGVLSGIFGTGNPGGDAEGISELLGLVLGSGFFSDRSMDMEQAARYLADHHLDDRELIWQDSGKGDGSAVLRLSEEQWSLVHTLELNVFYNDGEGFIDLGLDNVYEFDEDGALKGEYDGTWLAINGQPVAYYHMSTVDDGENYTITGRVPVLHNGQRSELILVFDNDTPYGYVAGVQAVYKDGATDTVAKAQEALQPGDVLEFICDYYTLDGSGMQYQDSYLMGDPITVTEEELTISNVPLIGTTRAAYRITDLYNVPRWTPAIIHTEG